SRTPGSSFREMVIWVKPGFHPSINTLMRPSALSSTDADTLQLRLSPSFPSHTIVPDLGERSRSTHPVTAVDFDCPPFLSCSAIQDSTIGRSLSRVAGSVGKMILTYTWLDCARVP